MIKCCAYVRVSSKEQTADNQLPAIREWVSAHGYTLDDDDIYQESESAWRVGHQRELACLLHELQSGAQKYGYCVIWSIDRLSREGVAKIFELMHSFKLYGCQIASVKEPWTETSGLMTDLLFAVSAWVAEYESARRSERVKAGIHRKVEKEGYKPGRPKGAKDNGKRRRTGYLLRYANPGMREKYATK